MISYAAYPAGKTAYQNYIKISESKCILMLFNMIR